MKQIVIDPNGNKSEIDTNSVQYDKYFKYKVGDIVLYHGRVTYRNQKAWETEGEYDKLMSGPHEMMIDDRYVDCNQVVQYKLALNGMVIIQREDCFQFLRTKEEDLEMINNSISLEVKDNRGNFMYEFLKRKK